MKISIVFFVLTVFCCFAISCDNDTDKVNPKVVTLDNGSLNQNPHFSLGRVLFYDTRLSLNNSISCASCHKQALGFSDNTSFSLGYQNEPSFRNSLPLANKQSFGSFPVFFWDGRENNLMNLVLQPIFNHVEMGMDDMDALIDRIEQAGYYQDLFQKAYGNDTITAEKISMSLYSFVSSISANLMPPVFSSPLSAFETMGKDLFNNKFFCDNCHVTNIYTFTHFANIGLDHSYTDQGRFYITNNPDDMGSFRVPSLINVALTAPYMHDGRFGTLEEVLDHYSHNIKNHPNLDFRLKASSGLPVEMNMTQQEQEAIIAFLNAFTDFNVITNPAFSDPFKY